MPGTVVRMEVRVFNTIGKKKYMILRSLQNSDVVHSSFHSGDISWQIFNKKKTTLNMLPFQFKIRGWCI